MRSLLRRALVEPGAFLASGEATPRRTAGLLAATSLVCLGPVPVLIVLLRSDRVPEEAIGSLPALVYAAGEASVSVPGLFALLVGLSAALPLLAVAVATPTFHGLSWPTASTGSLRATVTVAVWGLLPGTLTSVLSVATVYAAFALGIEVGGIQITFPARVVLAHPEPNAGWLLLEAISGLSVLWTGYVWTAGLAAVRGISPRRAAAAVALPLLVSVVLTPPGVRAVNWLACAAVDCPA